MPDWQIIARIACEMGYSEAFSYNSAEEVFDEIKRFSNPKTGYDLRGSATRDCVEARCSGRARRAARATATPFATSTTG